eukprot:SAG11_NODE_2281_length_3575_cov_2.137802_3_plen_64_part_00
MRLGVLVDLLPGVVHGEAAGAIPGLDVCHRAGHAFEPRLTAHWARHSPWRVALLYGAVRRHSA